MAMKNRKKEDDSEDAEGEFLLSLFFFFFSFIHHHFFFLRRSHAAGFFFLSSHSRNGRPLSLCVRVKNRGKRIRKRGHGIVTTFSMFIDRVAFPLIL
jgi:hypothetical protein